MIRFLILFIVFCIPNLSFSNAGGPPNGVAGNSPDENTCTNCHGSYDLNEGEGTLALLGIPGEGYSPNETYRLRVFIADSVATRWGFQLTALDDNDEFIGSLDLADDGVTQITEVGGFEYLSHTNNGTYRGRQDGTVWEFDWTAPGEDIGVVTFYFAGNAANANGAPTGDYIYANIETMEAAEVPEPDLFTLSLSDGWNFVSSPVNPTEPGLETLFSDLAENESISHIRNLAGQIFNPTAEVNEIGDWMNLSAYEILMNEAAEVEFSGELADPQAMIQLDQTWNWIAYTRTDTLAPSQAFRAFEMMDESMVWVKDEEHKFFLPGQDFNGLGMVEPGDGFKLYYLSENDSMNFFIWLDPMGEAEEPFLWGSPEFNLEPENYTNRSMSLLVNEWGNDFQPSPGDEIVIYHPDSPDNNTAGVGVVQEGSDIVPIILYEGPGGDFGLHDGMEITEFAYYSTEADMLIELRLSTIDAELIEFNADTYMVVTATPIPNAISKQNVDQPLDFNLISVSPNPFNNKTSIRFNLNNSAEVSAKLWDLNGRLLQTIAQDVFSAGSHMISLNADGLTTGMYLLELEANGIRRIERVVLMQ